MKFLKKTAITIGLVITLATLAYAADKTFRIDKIIENTAAIGVDVDGINIKDTTVKANTGNLTLDSTNQIIISKEAVFQAGIVGPGSVPIGGMVAVMPQTHANAWQPPANCSTIKDGFMRAGYGGSACVVPTCADCVIPAGTTLPNMNNDVYARGNDTSLVSGGANTEESNVTVGDHTNLALDNHTNLALDNHTNLALDNHTNLALDSHSNIDIAHGHGHGAPLAHGTVNGSSFNFNKNLLNTNQNNHAHSTILSLQGGVLGITNAVQGSCTGSTPVTRTEYSAFSGSSGVVGGVCTGWGLANWNSATIALAGTQALTNNHSGGSVTSLPITNKAISVHSFSQNIGAQGHTFSQNISTQAHTFSQNISTQAHSFSQDISAHGVTNNAVNNEPKFVSVIWVIRVK